MNRRKLSAGLVVGAMALVGLGVSGGVAHATPPPPPVLPAPSIFTLPLMVPLAVTVTTGPGGAITDVSVDPADAAITVTKARPGKVSFTTDTDGVKVTIKSKGQSQSMTARAGSLEAFTLGGGAGSWSGEVFPGVPGSVAYVVGGTPDLPTITVGAITGGGVAAPATTKVDDDGDEVSTRVVVTFTSASGTMTRDLTIRIKVENESDDDDDDSDDDDSDSSASLRVTLGKIRGVAGSEDAGDKSWGAILCDGTAGTVTYTVGVDGSISGVVAMVDAVPATDARIKTNDSKLEVRFATGERVKIRVSADGDGFTIKVKEKIRCRDAEDPTVNSVDVSDDDDDDDDDDDHHGGGDHGGGHGGDDKKSDD